MTSRLDLVNMLELRVGWKQPTYNPTLVNANNLISESGRYFQDEHLFVKIENIKSFIDKPNVSDIELNVELSNLRKQVVLSVVDDAFSGQNINNFDIDNCIEQLDACISKRMAIKVGELLIATTRSNRTERISKEAMQMFFFDVNGDPNFPNKLSIAEMYKKELDYIKDLFNTENLLDVHTLGNNRSDYEDNRNNIRFQ